MGMNGENKIATRTPRKILTKGKKRVRAVSGRRRSVSSRACLRSALLYVLPTRACVLSVHACFRRSVRTSVRPASSSGNYGVCWPARDMANEERNGFEDGEYREYCRIKPARKR